MLYRVIKNSARIGKDWLVIGGNYHRIKISTIGNDYRQRWKTEVIIAEYDTKESAVEHAKRLNRET